MCYMYRKPEPKKSLYRFRASGALLSEWGGGGGGVQPIFANLLIYANCPNLLFSKLRGGNSKLFEFIM